MRITYLLQALLIGSLAAPTPSELEARHSSLEARQQQPTKPKPCLRITPEPTANETRTRHDKFTWAFIYRKNITEAFEYIAQDYIVSLPANTESLFKRYIATNKTTGQNHNPAAQNGFDSAWNIISPIWGSQNITPLRNTLNGT